MKLNGAHWKSLALNNGLLTKNQCEMPKKLTKAVLEGVLNGIPWDHWPRFGVFLAVVSSGCSSAVPCLLPVLQCKASESHGIPKTTNGNDIAALDLLDLSAPRQLLCY